MQMSGQPANQKRESWKDQQSGYHDVEKDTGSGSLEGETTTCRTGADQCHHSGISLCKHGPLVLMQGAPPTTAIASTTHEIYR